jgi:hypothetical protein
MVSAPSTQQTDRVGLRKGDLALAAGRRLGREKPVRRGREMIDLLAVEEHAVVWFGPNPTGGQYSQGPGTQRKTSPLTATWQTDGNDR